MITKEEKDFANLQVKFRAEMINALAQHVTLTLDELKGLSCMMRNGTMKEIALTGPVEFRLIAAVVSLNPLRDVHSIKLRLEPKVREEYRYAEIWDRAMGGFTGEYRHSRDLTTVGTWEVIHDAMLRQVEPTTGASYEVLIRAAADTERKRVLAMNINSHELYATW